MYTRYMINHVLIGCMFLCYLIPIGIVYTRYSYNPSVSNIITDNTCKPYILLFMFFMGTCSLLYEGERNDIYCVWILGTLLLGLYGVIYIKEKYIEHFVFACIVFLSILGFMARQCYLHSTSSILFISFLVNLGILGILSINVHKNIFYSEVAYILNFAWFYVYLHVIDYGIPYIARPNKRIRRSS